MPLLIDFTDRLRVKIRSRLRIFKTKKRHVLTRQERCLLSNYRLMLSFPRKKQRKLADFDYFLFRECSSVGASLSSRCAYPEIPPFQPFPAFRPNHMLPFRSTAGYSAVIFVSWALQLAAVSINTVGMRALCQNEIAGDY